MMNSDNLVSRLTASSSFAVAWFRESWKILLGALVGTLIANILCLALWSDCGTVGFFYTLFSKDASVDIGFIGQVTGGDALDITTTPVLSDAQWVVDSKDVHRYMGNLKTDREWIKYTITLKARRQGNVFVTLKGPDKINDYGERHQVFVDYRNLNIHDKAVFSEIRKLSHEKHFLYHVPVKTGEEIRIQFEARRHCITPTDFDLLESGNFWYIITLSIASFTIFYILLSRFSAFRCHGKMADAVFLFSFFLLLLVPMSNVSGAQGRSRSQNRTLEKRPKLTSILQKNSEFGKRYEQWFADHLGGKEALIDLHSSLRNHIYHIIRTPKALYFKDSGEMFNIWALRYHSCDNMQPIVDSLTEFDCFLRRNNVKLYILEIPAKEFVYKEKWLDCPVYDRNLIKQYAITHSEFRDALRSRHIPYIFPYHELREGSTSDYTYFKWGHHCTPWGAYLCYKALIKELRRKFPDIPLQPIEDFEKNYSTAIRDNFNESFRVSELPTFFNFDLDKSHISKYTYYQHKHRDKLKKIYDRGEGKKDFAFPVGHHKIMMFGTSCNELLCSFLPYSAAQLKYIRINMEGGGGILKGLERWKLMKNYRNEILSYHPDILILSIFMNDYPALHYIDKK